MDLRGEGGVDGCAPPAVCGSAPCQALAYAEAATVSLRQGEAIKVSDPTIHRLVGPSHSRHIYLHPLAYAPFRTSSAPRDGPINPAHDWTALERRFWAAQPHVIVVDDFLSHRALTQVREWLQHGTMWHEVKVGHDARASNRRVLRAALRRPARPCFVRLTTHVIMLNPPRHCCATTLLHRAAASATWAPTSRMGWHAHSCCKSQLSCAVACQVCSIHTT